MRTGLFQAFTCITVLALSGCGSLLFNADFEADTIGAPPASSPVGNPTGDAIGLNAQTLDPPASTEPNVEVISIPLFTPPAPANNKGLVIHATLKENFKFQSIACLFSETIPNNASAEATFLIAKHSTTDMEDQVPFYIDFNTTLSLRMWRKHFEVVKRIDNAPDLIIADLGYYDLGLPYSVTIRLNQGTHTITHSIASGQNVLATVLNSFVAYADMDPMSPGYYANTQYLGFRYGTIGSAPEEFVELDQIKVVGYF